jgi:uncharacterized LabA/DUF88 family protein
VARYGVEQNAGHVAEVVKRRGCCSERMVLYSSQCSPSCGPRSGLAGITSFRVMRGQVLRMADRLILFIDHQNVYHAARAAFPRACAGSESGQFDPFKLGCLLASRGLCERELREVRVYRGLPDAVRDTKSNRACLRQTEAHLLAGGGKVIVVSRPVRYPSDWPQTPAREKGIDVALAVDFVQLAMAKQYDVGVIMSTDTDLRPALETVLGLRSQGGPVCEVAAWARPGCHSPRLSIPGARIWCHWLDEADYLSVAEPTNYSRGPGIA